VEVVRGFVTNNNIDQTRERQSEREDQSTHHRHPLLRTTIQWLYSLLLKLRTSTEFQAQ
jgi:hypothetical protein